MPGLAVEVLRLPTAWRLMAGKGLSRKFSSTVSFAFCLMMGLVQLQASAAESALSRFERTIAYLKQAPEGTRTDFASSALLELAAAHAREAALAREEIELKGPNRKLRGWAGAVDQYSRQMELLQQEAVAGAPVEFVRGEDGFLGLTVSGRMVIFNHPRSAQQSGFEQAVLAEFCSRHACEQFTPSAESYAPISVTTALVKPAWNFTDHGPVCSYQGVEIHFSIDQQLSPARRFCGRFLQELMILADELAWQRRHAVEISWPDLVIYPTPGGTLHRVQLNAAGDSLLVSVPLHFASEELLEKVSGWLQLRVEQSRASHLVLRAADYDWQ